MERGGKKRPLNDIIAKKTMKTPIPADILCVYNYMDFIHELMLLASA